MGRGSNSNNLLYGNHPHREDLSEQEIKRILELLLPGTNFSKQEWLQSYTDIIQRTNTILAKNSQSRLPDTKQNRLLINQMLQQFEVAKLHWLTIMTEHNMNMMFTETSSYLDTQKEWDKVDQIVGFLQMHQYLIDDQKLYEKILHRQVFQIADSQVVPFKNLSDNLSTVIQNNNHVLKQPSTIIFADNLDYHYLSNDKDGQLLCGTKFNELQDQFRYTAKAEHIFSHEGTQCSDCALAVQQGAKCQSEVVSSEQHLNYLLAQSASELSRHDPQGGIKSGFLYQAQFIAERVSRQYAEEQLTTKSVTQSEAKDLEYKLPGRIILNKQQEFFRQFRELSVNKAKFITQANVDQINENYIF